MTDQPVYHETRQDNTISLDLPNGYTHHIDLADNEVEVKVAVSPGKPVVIETMEKVLCACQTVDRGRRVTECICKRSRADQIARRQFQEPL